MVNQGAYPVPAGVINPDPWKFNAFDVRLGLRQLPLLTP